LVDRIEFRVEPSAIKHRPIAAKPLQHIEEKDVPIDLWSAASSISDTNLRQAFLRAALSSTERNEGREKN
jgi:hypothetical protein